MFSDESNLKPLSRAYKILTTSDFILYVDYVVVAF